MSQVSGLISFVKLLLTLVVNLFMFTTRSALPFPPTGGVQKRTPQHITCDIQMEYDGRGSTGLIQPSIYAVRTHHATPDPLRPPRSGIQPYHAVNR
jgi:hypothetical protein